MLHSIKPAVKGLITAIIMIATALTLYFTKQPANSPLHFLAYLLYAGGIIWTLLSYRQSAAFSGKFRDLFAQGFKCFIVVTLVMVTFSGIFTYMHPEFAEENAKAYKEWLLEQKTKTPSEIDIEVDTYKKQFNLRFISQSIFGYLLIGAIVTAGFSALLTRRIQ